MHHLHVRSLQCLMMMFDVYFPQFCSEIKDSTFVSSQRKVQLRTEKCSYCNKSWYLCSRIQYNVYGIIIIYTSKCLLRKIRNFSAYQTKGILNKPRFEVLTEVLRKISDSWNTILCKLVCTSRHLEKLEVSIFRVLGLHCRWRQKTPPKLRHIHINLRISYPRKLESPKQPKFKQSVLHKTDKVYIPVTQFLWFCWSVSIIRVVSYTQRLCSSKIFVQVQFDTDN